MTELIKLSENDFDYIHWEKDSAGPELFELIIYGKSELHCNEIKQQILDNQEIKEKLETLYLKIKSEIQNGKMTTNLFELKEILGDKK